MSPWSPQEGLCGQRAVAAMHGKLGDPLSLTRLSHTVIDDWNGEKETADGQTAG